MKLEVYLANHSFTNFLC